MCDNQPRKVRHAEIGIRIRMPQIKTKTAFDGVKFVSFSFAFATIAAHAIIAAGTKRIKGDTSFLPPRFRRFFELIRHPDFNRSLGGVHWRQFQDRDEIFRRAVRPGVAPFGFGMADKIKNLDIALPDSFRPEHFPRWHAFAVNRFTGVQVQDYRLQALNVIVIIRHNV